jgi:hypothetical protein
MEQKKNRAPAAPGSAAQTSLRCHDRQFEQHSIAGRKRPYAANRRFGAGYTRDHSRGRAPAAPARIINKLQKTDMRITDMRYDRETHHWSIDLAGVGTVELEDADDFTYYHRFRRVVLQQFGVTLTPPLLRSGTWEAQLAGKFRGDAP